MWTEGTGAFYIPPFIYIPIPLHFWDVNWFVNWNVIIDKSTRRFAAWLISHHLVNFMHLVQMVLIDQHELFPVLIFSWVDLFDMTTHALKASGLKFRAKFTTYSGSISILSVYYPQRQLFPFPGFKTVKQMKEMKDLAVSWNDWKKSGIFFKSSRTPL